MSEWPENEERDIRLAAALRAARRIFPNGPAMDRAQAQLIIDEEFGPWSAPVDEAYRASLRHPAAKPE